jgi:hypothetical protein
MELAFIHVVNSINTTSFRHEVENYIVLGACNE